MKWVLAAAGALVTTAVAAQIGLSAPYVPPSTPLIVAIQVAVQGGGKPFIIGKTNLPDGFQAIASLQDGPKILAQDKIEVRSGQFTAGPFSFNGAAYPRGRYLLSIDSPMADLQPAPVRETIGKDGFLLGGPLVKPDVFGAGHVVHFQQSFTIQ